MAEIDYLSATQMSKVWGITPRRIAILCSNNRIVGAKKIGNTWIIPVDSKKPIDARTIAIWRTRQYDL